MRDLREDAELNQEDIAAYLHIQQGTYSDYETGKRHITGDTLDKLADFYKTSADYIMGRTDEKTPYPKAKYNING
jgi:transcriptional regulator with XRE-family HTH domain